MAGTGNTPPTEPSRPLTPKQAAFVREYLIDLNATQAAIRTGYSAKTANEQGARLLANASIRAAVQAAMDARAERTEITADYVLFGIMDTTERCRAKGEEFNPAGAFKGFELLGKHLKLFTDKIEHSADADLAAILSARRAAVAKVNGDG